MVSVSVSWWLGLQTLVQPTILYPDVLFGPHNYKQQVKIMTNYVGTYVRSFELMDISAVSATSVTNSISNDT